jgi:hypothetical protein
MQRRWIKAAALALSLSLCLGGVASARGVEKRGSCSGGRGEWRIAVRSESDGKLRVRFEIEHVPAGQTWQVFLSDNGTGIFSGTRRASSSGEVHVTVFPRNRPGTDRIAASGVNSGTGIRCEGVLSF